MGEVMTLEAKARRILELHSCVTSDEEAAEYINLWESLDPELARAYLRLREALVRIYNYSECNDERAMAGHICCSCEARDALKEGE